MQRSSVSWDKALRQLVMHDTPQKGGPMRTLMVGDRIAVYGDLAVADVKGRRVKVRVVTASPPPERLMIHRIRIPELNRYHAPCY